ncbi:LysR family transcriptional regulator [Nannocystis pusilla]|uniref:LysR family transcriptional regulator n=1 Tax=Nannocystis pusilla TaxID=889268 RepID=A0ABS7TKL0_9BACT|nr:LysR family transcriptional regulator [Nannocystis pusilla]MBZ5708758.1 LysR family transcriptional regulator [Nannocystis pusilla]
MQHHLDWRDLRIALALARHVSLNEAGRALRLDPTTISRRISALEATTGTALFVRDAEGWRLTEAGRRVVDAAGRMATEVRELARDLEAASERAVGTVRLTTLDYIAASFLAPRLPLLRARHPELVLDLRCTEQVLDLVAGQADVALRVLRPTEAGVRVRRLAQVSLGLFGLRSYVEHHGLDPLPPAAEAELVILGPPDSRLPEMRWMRALVPRGRVAAATNDVPTSYSLVRAGVGLGVMTLAAAEGHPELVRLDRDAPPLERALWRVVPEALADAPKIRAVVDWIDEVAEDVGVGS